jgi:hypothetical protein
LIVPAGFLVELLDGGTHVGQCRPAYARRLEAVAQEFSCDDRVRIRLQHARRLKRRHLGVHLRGEAETGDQHATHHEHQQCADTYRDELARTIGARKVHA